LLLIKVNGKASRKEYSKKFFKKDPYDMKPKNMAYGSG